MTNRGVSVSLNYVLSLAIATVIVSGLLFAAGDVVGDRQEAVVRGELRVVGEQIASSLATADRLARTGGSTVVVDVESPDRVGGLSYTITIDPTESEVVLATPDRAVVVYVPYRSETTVLASETTGGDVEIVLTPGGALEVRST